ncbi:MAG TPA: helix-turn-helix transcriptional regulator [Fibrobacteria bacterium]|nr:helix-turn-helix transcriptional regulator [Fibrobacteria bacterium]
MASARGLLFAAALLSTGAALALRLPQSRKHAGLFPGRPVYLYSFDDHGSGGVSRILALDRSDSGLRFTFVLGNTLATFVGAGAAWQSDSSNRTGEVDFAPWDDVELSLRTSRPLRLRMILVAHDSAIWKNGDYLTRRYSEARFSPRPDGSADIPLGQFALSPWWIDRGLVPVSDTTRKLDHVVAFEIQAVPGGVAADGRVDTVLIRSVRLVRHRHLAGTWVWWLPGLAWLAVAFGLLPRRRPATEIGIAAVASPPGPAPLGLRSESDELRDRLAAHLASNYQRGELDADTVCRETGIPRSRLPEILREGFGTTFKAYLNELRLTEASRLLRTTDRTVSEIAFAVGYNGIAHFNRVFRERFGLAPGEHRSAVGGG